MRFFSALFVMLVTVSAVAMSPSAQDEYMAEVAKNIRKSFWQTGHVDVSSSVSKMTKETLDNHVKSENNDQYESPLGSEEIASLYRCYYRKACELYLVDVGGSMYGGYGTSAHFILLYTKSKKHFEIKHVTYSE